MAYESPFSKCWITSERISEECSFRLGAIIDFIEAKMFGDRNGLTILTDIKLLALFFIYLDKNHELPTEGSIIDSAVRTIFVSEKFGC